MLGLVQDEPTEGDKIEEVNGLRFLVERTVADHLQRYLPLNVHYDERHWFGLRVTPSSRTCA